MSKKSRISVAVLTSAALGITLAGLGSPVQAASTRSLAGSVPSWANAANKAGATSTSTKVDFRVYLDWRGGAAAENLARAVSTPGSASYRKFLSPAQFNAQFAPSSSSVNAVKNWLHANGFTLGHVPSNSKYVEAIGTVGQAAAAFHTSFANYTVDGSTLRSNSAPLVVPSSLSDVTSVVGLDESTALVQHDAQPASSPPGVFKNGRPCSAYWGEKTVGAAATPDGQALPSSPSAFAPCGYTPDQLRGAYGTSAAVAHGNDGTGVTVAVIDAYASPTIVTDVNTYSSLHGLPQLGNKFAQKVAPGTYVRGDNKRQSPSGWSGEETLDIEAVHGMAPGANILYVGSANNYQDMDGALNWVVSRRAADIVTNSYGFASESLPRGYIKPQNDILIQAAAEGISMFFSSGDCSDETTASSSCDAQPSAPTPDWPASSPWVTAVGGTSLGVGVTNNRLFEFGWATGRSSLDKTAVAWNTPTWLYGAGGGTSRLFAQPSYQAGVVPSSMSQVNGGAAMRVVPDVSAVGDPTTGMLVGQTQTFPDGHTAYDEYRIGGTSLSSPLYAGMFALAQQRAGHPLGFANPALYAAAANDITKAGLETNPGAVRVDFLNGVDGTDGYNYTARFFDFDSPLSIHVAPGYDNITGVGSPAGTSWLDDVAGF